ncbi:MAG: hypothetical protein OXF09_04850 [Hyphomicrobiales bacterium]|nr:hypothetical protein [Hyphomicrobiales bacterium]
MKTILTTTFVVALMVFAFNADPAAAKSASCPEGQVSTYGGDCIKKRVPGERRSPPPPPTTEEIIKDWHQCIAGVRAGQNTEGDCALFGQIDEINDPGQAGNERDVADSGDEGSTSAAGANDQ